MTMNNDYIAALIFSCFGLWLLLFPQSAIAFYTWFHKGHVKMPTSRGVRIAGFIWILIIVGVIAAR